MRPYPHSTARPRAAQLPPACRPIFAITVPPPGRRRAQPHQTRCSATAAALPAPHRVFPATRGSPRLPPSPAGDPPASEAPWQTTRRLHPDAPATAIRSPDRRKHPGPRASAPMLFETTLPPHAIIPIHASPGPGSTSAYGYPGHNRSGVTTRPSLPRLGLWPGKYWPGRQGQRLERVPEPTRAGNHRRPGPSAAA